MKNSNNIYIDHDQFIEYVGIIADTINSSDWIPDFLVSSGSTSTIPATYVSNIIRVPTLSINFDSKIPSFAEELLVKIAKKSIEGERYLFIDSINDSGKEILHIKNQLISAGAEINNIKFATLIDNVRSISSVDYRSVNIDRYIEPRDFIFPWQHSGKNPKPQSSETLSPENIIPKIFEDYKYKKTPLKKINSGNYSKLELLEKLAEISSPEIIVKNNKLDIKPNYIFDRPKFDVDLPIIPALLRQIVSTIIASLPSNTRISLRSSLTTYSQELLIRGTQPILGILIAMEDAISAGYDEDIELWDDATASLFENYFDWHDKFITHFPLNAEREVILANISIDEIAASGSALTAPIDKVTAASKLLHEEGLATDEFDRFMTANRELNNDIASLPVSVDNQNETTQKSRHIFMTVATYERIVAATAGVATIALTQTGQALIEAIKNAITKLMAFIF
jgi:uncharacterized protein